MHISEYHYRRTYTSAPSVSSTYRTGTGSAVFDRRRTATGSTAAAYRSVPSLASHLELQRALDSLNDDSRYGTTGSELVDATCGIPAAGRYGFNGTATGSGSSYYGCDGSSSDQMRSSTYSRSVEPLSLSSATRSSYSSAPAATVSIRTSTYTRRR
jgi:hypothetical protein